MLSKFVATHKSKYRGMTGPASGIPTLARTTLGKIFSHLAIGVACMIGAVSAEGVLRRVAAVEAT